MFSYVGYVNDHASLTKHKAAPSKVKQRQGFQKSIAIAVSHSQAATNKFLHTAFSLALLVVLENLLISKWDVLLDWMDKTSQCMHYIMWVIVSFKIASFQRVKAVTICFHPCASAGTLLGWGIHALTGSTTISATFGCSSSMISKDLLATHLARIASSPFYSIILDNSKDIGNEDHCLIFLTGPLLI